MFALLLLTACGPAPATFTQVQADIFTNSCAFSTCHGEGSGAQGLSLVDGVSYAAIVEVPSTIAPEINLVEPGDHENSYLWQKCAGVATPAMPSSDGLDAEHLAELESWIDNGALDD